jgi:hypothetical protein
MTVTSQAQRLLRPALERAGLLERAREAREAFLRRRDRFGRRISARTGGRHAARLAGGSADLHVVPVGPRLVAARRLEGLTADSVRQRNFELVLSAFEKHGVPHLVLPVGPKEPRRVAVPETTRAEAGAALLESAPASTFVGVGESISPGGVTPMSDRHAARRRLLRTRAPIWNVFELYAERPGTRFLGADLGCEVELWSRRGDRLVEPRFNRLAEEVPAAMFGRNAAERGRLTDERTPYFDDVAFPVDVVYTWVDGSDPQWIASRKRILAELEVDSLNEEDHSLSRYLSRDELRYSLRSLEMFAGFVNHVWLVTADQRPDWLVANHPRLTVVSHSEIFDDPAHLPTFNSHAIEARIHRIQGLAEHYIYMNDDVFFTRRVVAEDFFRGNGMAAYYLSTARIPIGAPTVAARGVDAAAMNGRALIEERFGIRVTRKFRHAPHPQIKAVHQDLERWFPEQTRRTAASTVRSPSDLALASSLHHYAAYATGRAVEGSLRTSYLNLAVPDLKRNLDRLLHRQIADTLCLNDTTRDESQSDEQESLVRRFLEDSFPSKSSFEH